MALESDPPYLGDIGDDPEEPEPDPDWVYEREMELRAERPPK